MQQQTKQTYEFGPFRLDSVRRVLRKESEEVPLTPKAFETLLALIEANGQLLEKDELMQRLWPDSFVEEGNLTVYISMLRKALGENRGEHRYIVTVPGRGYRFVADVRELGGGDELVVEEQTRARVVIESEKVSDVIAIVNQPSASASPRGVVRSRFNKVAVPLTGLAALVLVLAGFYAWISGRLRHINPAGNQISSIAVLPFRSLSGDPDDKNLSFGITETLIAKLTSTGQITVRQTSAVRKYTAADTDPVEAGREMKVDSVLDGSLQKIGQRIRITVSLVRVDGSGPVWSDTFDGDAANVFALQDSICKQVVRALPIQLTTQQEQLLVKRYTHSSEAYQLYMRGRYFWNKRTTEDLYKSIDSFQQAIAKDPSYALAYSGLADSYSLLGSSGAYNVASPDEVMPKARQAAQQALALDDSIAEAHTSLGIVALLYDWNWQEAEDEFKRAIEINPNYAVAHYWYTFYLIVTGRMEDALSKSRQAREVDPASLSINLNVGRTLYFARRYDEAIVEYQKTLEMNKGFLPARFLLGIAYDQNGMRDAAIAELQTVAATSPDKAWAITTGAYAEAIADRKEAALQRLAELQELAKQVHVSPHDFAMVYLRLGDNAEAFKWLDKAYEEHSSTVIYLRADPSSDPLRADPRFAALMQRIGQPL